MKQPYHLKSATSLFPPFNFSWPYKKSVPFSIEIHGTEAPDVSPELVGVYTFALSADRIYLKIACFIRTNAFNPFRSGATCL